MKNKKSALIVGVVIVVILIFNGNSIFAGFSRIKSLIIGGWTVPRVARVFLETTTEENVRVPVLILKADAGGCNEPVSDLKVKKTVKDDLLVVKIKGYDFTKHRGGWCSTSGSSSYAKINVDPNWLKGDEGKEIVFKLGGKDNKYKITYSEYKVTLSGIETSNVISRRPGYNLTKDPEILEMMLYPADVFVMSVGSKVERYEDCVPELRDFAKNNGFTPVEDAYPGFQQNRLDESLLLVVPRGRSMPAIDHNTIVGELEIEGKMGNVRVVRIGDTAGPYRSNTGN